MKLKKRIVGFAASVCMMTGWLVQLSAYAATLVPVLEGISLPDRTGQIFIHVKNQDELHVTVDKIEPEGIFRYYDTELIGAEGQSETVYQMDLSRCEYLVDTGEYASWYAVSISAGADPDAVYTQNLVVQDPDFEKIEGCEHHFYITLEQGESAGFELLASRGTTEENILIYEQYFVLRYQEELLGDLDGNGVVEISDATAVLTYYAQNAASLDPEINMDAADIDRNGIIEIKDATCILTYYAQYAAGLDPDWSDLIE
ncbi:MAG: hypothetical protein IJ496_01065 [Ruminococcus sp.]|nr:hypothetical protein [Ruminococcus sp.]